MSLRAWWRPQPHDARRSIDLIRILVALVLVAHPLWTMTHPAELLATTTALAARHLPAPAALTWLAMITLTLSSLGLLSRRTVVPAAIVSMLMLATGALLLYAPYWFVVGGAFVEGHPGVEYNLLLLVALAGVLWTYWPSGDSVERAARGHDLVRIGTALLIMQHPLHAYLTWDVEGMRRFGQGMSEIGFPFGVPLVWFMISWQIVCCVALIARRAVVPAAVGHLFVLLPGIYLEHYPDWFAIGPNLGGMEFPVVFIVCFVSSILAYWPIRAAVAARTAAPAVAA